MISAASVWKVLEHCIDEVEQSGYDLEMTVQSGDDRTKGSQTRLRRMVQLIKQLKKVKKTALELGL